MAELNQDTLNADVSYRILTGVITPRPIAFVSTLSPTGQANLAPFSFFNGVSAAPMVVSFSPMTKDDGSDKDTLRNLLPPEQGGTGEFVVHVATEDLVREVSAAAANLPADESEFELTGLASVPSVKVRPPRVAKSPVALECRTLQVIRLAPGVPMSGNLVLGQVVHVFVDDALVDERFRVPSDRLATVGRMAGPLYCRSRDLFSLPRGPRALTAPLPWLE